MDAVLPLARRDYRRARLCLRSLRRLRGLGTVWVVHEEGDSHLVEALAADFPFVRLLPEGDVIPQGRPRSVLHRIVGLADTGVDGWYRQQLIKMAIARCVQTDFYLTLDADVLCTAEVDVSHLLKGGRALTVRHEMCHPIWYRVSSMVLSMPRLKEEYGVTPAILHRASCLDLVSHIGGGCGPEDPRWVDTLGRFVGWTEYSLYYTFLTHTGQLEERHQPVDYAAWFGPCAWSGWLPGDPSWTPERAFAPRATGWFSLVSSRARVSIETLESMLEPHLSD